MTEEQKAQAKELMTKVATACNGYDALVVMTMLESAMQAEIERHDPLIAQLFAEMMDEFRKEASILLGVSMLMKAVKNAKTGDAFDMAPLPPADETK